MKTCWPKTGWPKTWWLALTLTACADPAAVDTARAPEGDDPAPDPFADETIKIRDGEVTTERPEVGSIGGCTATLIAPDLAITAAHCVGYNSALQRGRYLTFRLDAAGGAHRVTVDRYRSFSRDLGAYDVALLGLAEAVPESVARPAPIAREDPTRGSSVTVYGYGCTQIGAGSDGRKRKATFRFGDASAHLCPGDSGGPVFDNTTGAIFGINSGYRLDRLRTDIYGNVPTVYRDLVAQAEQWTAFSLPGVDEGNPAPQDDPPGGGGAELRTCAETLECRRTGCNLQGASCLQGCLDRSEPSAVALWRGVYDCAVAANCQNFSCTEQRCAAQLAACRADEGPEEPEQEEPEQEEPEPQSNGPICGEDMQVFARWACTASGRHRHRCLAGQGPVWEACASGCFQPGPGVDAQCRAEAPQDGELAPHADLGACTDAYRPYPVWACATDNRTLVRCEGGRLQVHRCASGCTVVPRAPDTCQ